MFESMWRFVLTFVAATALLMGLGSCGDDHASLRVVLVSDYAPGAEVARATTELRRGGGADATEQPLVARADRTLRAGDALARGLTIASLDGLSDGTYTATVTLLSRTGGRVAGRPVTFEVRGEDLAVTTHITVSCATVLCPAAGSLGLTACFAGVCADPRCTPETPEHCPVGAVCTGDDACALDSPCAAGVCSSGACVAEPIAGRCDESEYCAREDGCAPIDGPVLPGGPDERCGTICLLSGAPCEYGYYACRAAPERGTEAVCTSFLRRPVGAPCGDGRVCDEAGECVEVPSLDGGARDGEVDADVDAADADVDAADADIAMDDDADVMTGVDAAMEADGSVDGDIDPPSDGGSADAAEASPCDVENGGCDPMTTCVAVGGVVSCGACPDGYNGTGETACVDIDECGAAVCGAGEVCVNEPGGYRCDCAGGSHRCGASCVSNDSVDSCGARCTPCFDALPLHAEATCDGTQCGLRCDAGFVLQDSVCDRAWSQRAYIKSNVAYSSDQFGVGVSLSGDGRTLAVGALYRLPGRVYVYRRTGDAWTLEAELTPTGGSPREFGTVSLSYDGNSLIVGAWRSSFDRGGVYFFERSGTAWSQTGYLLPSTVNSGERFGLFVAMSGDGMTATAALAATHTTGAVYVFRRTGSVWAEEARLTSAPNQVQDNFGFALDLSFDGNVLAVGARGESSNATGVGGDRVNVLAPFSGAAYVFRRAGVVWTEDAYLKASVARDNTRFGASLSMNDDGTTLVVATEVASPTLTVFRFATGAWTLTEEVTRASPLFAPSVLLSGDGSTIVSMLASSPRRAVVFRNVDGEWQERGVAAAATRTVNTALGESMSIDRSGDRFVLGSRYEPSGDVGINNAPILSGGANPGAVHYFEITEARNGGCDDGLDNDLDGLVDAADPGCIDAADDSERGTTQCDDGLDNDDDGTQDYRPSIEHDFGCDSPSDDDEASACNDGLDNDGDGFTDLDDRGCPSIVDNDEREKHCEDGLDNDGDGYVDVSDPGCSSRDDTSERGTLICDNGLDDDGDGFIDLADIGCDNVFDGDEANPACGDGVDNDGDGHVDLDDDGCESLYDASERLDTACDNGLDDDGDGLADADDPGCDDASDEDERGSAECDDGLDNDGDGYFDYRAGGSPDGGDIGCESPADDTELRVTECNDGLDNDGDGQIDFSYEGMTETSDYGCWDYEYNPEEDTSEFAGEIVALYYFGYALECDDGVDNDDDGLIDFRIDGSGDPECTDTYSYLEDGSSPY